MEITNLENPIDDELMTELRDLTIRMEGLLNGVRTNRFPFVPEIELDGFRCLDILIEAPIDLLN